MRHQFPVCLGVLMYYRAVDEEQQEYLMIVHGYLLVYIHVYTTCTYLYNYVLHTRGGEESINNTNNIT